MAESDKGGMCKNFNAAADGREVSIFRNWADAQASTDKFKGNCHKGFETLPLEEAKGFLTLNNIQPHDITLHNDLPVDDNVEHLMNLYLMISIRYQ